MEPAIAAYPASLGCSPSPLSLAGLRYFGAFGSATARAKSKTPSKAPLVRIQLLTACHLACPSIDQIQALPNGVIVAPKIFTPCECAAAIIFLYPPMIWAALTLVLGASQPRLASSL